MKKLISFFIAILIICTFAFTAFAQEEFEKMKDLNNYWATNDAYPDYFCGIWTETGSLDNLVVAVLDTEEGNRGKQEILDLIEDDSSVTFTYGDYSRNYLIDVQHSFTREMFKELGLSYTAILDDQSRIELGILKDKKNDPVSIQMLDKIKEQYGDIFIVKYVDGLTSDDMLYLEDLPAISNTAVAETESKPSYCIYIAVVLTLLLSVMAILILIRHKRLFLLQANTGHTVNVSSSLSAKEVENLVRNTEPEVPLGLEEKIFKAIDSRHNI